MHKEQTINYLEKLVNRTENISELLQMYIYSTSSRAGAIFIRNGTSNTYNCIEHINLDDKSNIKVKFEPIVPIEDISFDLNIGYVAPYSVSTIINIPITIDNECIGIVCLLNRLEKYTEEIVNLLTLYISLTQLILSKEKILKECKEICNLDSQDKDLFLANMSHEIRTPANGVIGYGQLLMQTELSSVQRNYLTSQNQCCIQLMQIINNVLDFSKLSSGKMVISTECFTINEVIETIHSTIGQRINDKKQKIKFIVDDEFPMFIIMDKQKLIQIIINLTSNAYKFSDIGGEIEITFSVLHLGKIQVTVKDNGIGISEQNQNKLFNAFEQIKTTDSRYGTGLGLVISQKLAKLLGGYISVKSTLGLGSTFSLTATFKPYEEYEKIIQQNSKLLKDKMILVVDDNTDNRILITELLFEWQMKPIICASALEALRMVMSDRYNFSIGLIDICMPGTSGSELAKQIKEERPLFPLIALSSLDTFITTKDFEQKLDKPINKIQLFNAIHSILSKKKIQSAFIGEENSSSDSSSPSYKFNKNARILITEDITYNRNMLENMLENLKYNNIDSAENGKIAIEMIEKANNNGKPYDIILLDLRMPIMDGYEVIDIIKKQNWNIKIVVISASVMDEDRKRCKSIGIQYFITKPIAMSQLKDVMLHITELM